jgi:hypothetical protein
VQIALAQANRGEAECVHGAEFKRRGLA